jgi:hypothetical protein
MDTRTSGRNTIPSIEDARIFRGDQAGGDRDNEQAPDDRNEADRTGGSDLSLLQGDVKKLNPGFVALAGMLLLLVSHVTKFRPSEFWFVRAVKAQNASSRRLLFLLQ